MSQYVPLLIGAALASHGWLLEGRFLQGTIGNICHPLRLSHTAVIRTTANGLAGVVSLLPAGLGTIEASAIGLAMTQGANRRAALSTTLVLRFVTLAVPYALARCRG